MSNLNLENIVGFKAVDKDGNEQNVTVDEMVDMVSTRMVSALSETSTFAAAAAAGTDEFEDQLPQSDTFSWLRTLDGSKNPTLTSSSAAAKVLGGLMNNLKLFRLWEGQIYLKVVMLMNLTQDIISMVILGNWQTPHSILDGEVSLSLKSIITLYKLHQI